MTVDEARQVVYAAARLRLPRLKDLGGTQARVAALEDYLVETAIHRGELEEARLHLQDALGELLEQWDMIEGWQQLTPALSKRTQDDIRRAKRTCRPDLHEGIRVAKNVIARLCEQIRRLEKDDDAASRLYTMVTGG